MVKNLDFLNPIVFGASLAILTVAAFFESGMLVAIAAPLTIASFWLPIKIYFSRSLVYVILYAFVLIGLWSINALIGAVTTLILIMILAIGNLLLMR